MLCGTGSYPLEEQKLTSLSPSIAIEFMPNAIDSTHELNRSHGIFELVCRK